MMIKSNKSIACIAKKECLKQKRVFAFEHCGPKNFIKVVLGVIHGSLLLSRWFHLLFILKNLSKLYGYFFA